MASGDDPTQILVQPGNLSWGATDLTQSFPHGGSGLGLTQEGIRVRHQQNTQIIRSETTGVAPQEIIYLGEHWILEVEFKQWNTTTVSRLFPNVTTSSKEIIEVPGSTAYPGYKMTNEADVLVFSPTDLTEDRVVLFRNAVPVAQGALVFRSEQESRLTCYFHALEDSSISSGDANYSTRTAAIGDRDDLTI